MIGWFKRRRALAVRVQIHAYESAREPLPRSEPLIGGDRYEVFGGRDQRPKMTLVVHDDGSGILDLEIVMQSMLMSPAPNLREMVAKQDAIIRGKLG